MASSMPISTVYVQNLEERVKLDALVDTLRTVFAEFGNVVDIVAKKNLRAKGQAFVVYDSPESAQDAINEIDGFELFGKPMKLAFARTQSDKTIELKGNQEELEQHKRHRQAEKGRIHLISHLISSLTSAGHIDKRKALESAEEQRQINKRGSGSVNDNRPAKAAKSSGLKSTSAAASGSVLDEFLPPNKILFVQNFPEDYDIETLTSVFGRFDGFREVRLVPGRRGIAFVEYEAEQGAITAKENTAGLHLGDKPIKVTYQRQ
ncbi:related to small nuclear ribonucleoprotein snRNP U1A [Fusarium oxysporum]|uniref:Related to small nuclear ribonucleoprotein snRNP U1A n=1 Tax=Fusarium oxysporum TaxID=5507 RepID=A0A2H3TLN7_FUSOX|nr:related to small nuclear ribonucleoprotein snRNP U1A [Fusarium oxysporum]